MGIFKKNLTSQLVREAALKIINKKKSSLTILELGCGDGNISKYLLEKQKEKKRNKFYASDISKESIIVAKKNQTEINYKNGNLFEPWQGQKFNIIISDVSSINDKVAQLSPWYKNVVCDSGDDGLKNIITIINTISKYSEKEAVFILPIISLCNTKKLNKLLKKKFKNIFLTKKTEWPLPSFFLKNIKKFKILKKQKRIEFEEKFGFCIAYTRVAICKL
jgi:methylase of polypeptide subunit release factors